MHIYVCRWGRLNIWTELYALCGMLCAGNLGQRVGKIPTSQEALAANSPATGQTGLEQGPSAFLLPMAMA